MSKNLKLNYVYNLIYQLITFITPLITAPYIARVLGPECIGELSYTESVVSYFVLFASLGMSTYGAREISYVQDDIQKRSEIFWNTKILSFFTSITCLIIYFFFLLLKNGNNKLFILASVLIANVFFDVTWFFQGLEEFGKIVLRNILFRLLSVCFIFIFVHSKNDFYIYVTGLYILQFLCTASLIPLLKPYICKPQKIKPFTNFKTILSLFIPTIAISIYTVFDKTMIGIFSMNSSENGFYEQALKLSKMLLIIITSLGVVVVPRIGKFIGLGDYESVKKYMYRSYQFVFLLGIPLYLGLYIVSKNFVPWFYGDDYEKVIPLLKILGFLILSIGINNVTGVQYLVPTKRQNLFTFTVLIGATVNFILNLFLIPKFYSIGAAIASVIAETTIAIIQLFLVRKELSILSILKKSWKYFIGGFAMFFVLLLISDKLVPSIRNTLILFIVGVVVYSLSLFLLQDEFFLNNVRNILYKITKGVNNDRINKK